MVPKINKTIDLLLIFITSNLSIFHFMYISIDQSIIHMPYFISADLSFYLSSDLFIYIFNFLSVNLLYYLSIYLSIDRSNYRRILRSMLLLVNLLSLSLY